MNKTILVFVFLMFFSIFCFNVSAVIKIVEIQPSDNSVDNCPCCLAICANLSNTSGDKVKMAFQSNYSGSWSVLEDSHNVNAGEMICICVPEFTLFNHTYYWRILYYDNGVKYSENYSLTTAQDADSCPCGVADTVRGDIREHNIVGIIGIVGIFGLLGFILNSKRGR